jgi:hypothetical protein
MSLGWNRLDLLLNAIAQFDRLNKIGAGPSLGLAPFLSFRTRKAVSTVNFRGLNCNRHGGEH